MKIDGSAVRTGMVLEHENKLWVVVKHEIRTPGNLRAFNQIEMKDVVTGIKTNMRLSSSEQMERAQLDSKPYNYLYDEDGQLVFMDNETFEQVYLSKDLLGDRLPFLQDGMTVTIETYDGRPITIDLPEKVTLAVTETEPVVKGQTASSSYKPAILENGVRTSIPPHIDAGTRIVIRTADASYVERAKD